MNDNNEDITFHQLWTDYDEYMKIKLKPQSYRKMNSSFKNHILPYFKDYLLKDINYKVYLNWQLEIEKKGYKHAYNKFLHYANVGILNYAIKIGYINQNVASQFGCFKKKKAEKKNIEIWTIEEFNQFISVVDENLYRLLFTTLFFTGLRIGECLALTWEDFNGNSLDINKTISKEKINNEYILTSPKTVASERIIYLDERLCDELNNLYKEQSKLKDFENSWFIFGGKKPLTRTTIERRKNNYCTLANIKKIRLHDFRHSHTTLLLDSGVPITAISNRLGHSDISMTLNVYSHLTQKSKSIVVDTINKIRVSNSL